MVLLLSTRRPTNRELEKIKWFNFSGNNTSFSLALPDSEFTLAISPQPVKEQSHVITFTSFHTEIPMLDLISSETCRKCAEIHHQDMRTCKCSDKRNMPFVSSLLVRGGSQAVSLGSVTCTWQFTGQCTDHLVDIFSSDRAP